MHGPAFEPLQVGPMRLRNRVVRTAHGVRVPWSDDGGGQIAYHLARAKGGAAMAIMGIGGVHPSNPTVVPSHEDRVIPGLAAIADAVHEYDMRLVLQIWHGGAVKPNALGGSPWSCSPVPNYTTGFVPIAMTKSMIDEMVEHFAKAAGRVRRAGLDGVELHGANGYLITQFLSRASNHREDEYGGSLENRMRFLNEVLDAVRSEVGAELAIGLRLSSEEFVEDGLTPPETSAIAQALEAKFDYLNVSTGGYFRPDFIAAPMDLPMAYQIGYSSEVTKNVAKPTIVTGRIMTMDVANEIVGSGQSDMVSMVRGLIADPEIVLKSAEDRTEQIRPCIGMLMCVGSTLSDSFACAVNPSAGHEIERPPLDTVPAPVPRRVLIAGGGPAGMEAARSAALRGHEVTLYELRKQLGGQVNIAASSPHRSDIGAITHWQADELARIGVKIVLNTAVDPDVVLGLDPDVLVLATGSSPRDDGIQLARPHTPLPGFQQKHVYSSWDLFGFGHGRSVQPGTHALVYDDTGEYEPLAVADELAQRGVRVTYVTGFDSFGERIAAHNNTITPTLRRLVEGGVELITRSTLMEIGTDEVQVRVGDRLRTFPATSVFFVGINVPNRELTDYLHEYRGEIETIGDAAGFHTLTKAIHDGDAIGRAI